jgi:hypothetical protein
MTRLTVTNDSRYTVLDTQHGDQNLLRCRGEKKKLNTSGRTYLTGMSNGDQTDDPFVRLTFPYKV